MRWLRKWRRLSPADRRLFLQALWWVVMVRLMMPLVRARRLIRWFAVATAARGLGSPQDDMERALWAVSAAARRVPRATCLVQALVGRKMLAQRGIDVTLRLGVKKGPGGAFLAHAWLERAGVVVLGLLPDLQTFTVLNRV